jgi:predicted membrane-bound mannosyltransferase
VLGINRALFWILGPGDATARLLPAVIGTVLPLAAWLLLPILGRRGALAAAALLAVSPSLVLLSRTVSGAIPGLAAAFLWWVAAWRYRHEGVDRWLIVSGVGLGLGIASGATFITMSLLILGASWAANRAGFLSLWHMYSRWRPWAVALAVALLVSTSVLAYPDGVGAVAGGLGAWIAGFDLGWQPLGLLAVYELAALALGLLGLLDALRRGEWVQRMLAYWALGGVLLGFFRAGQPDAVLCVLLPLCLLAGIALNRLLVSVSEHPRDRSALLAGTAVITILGIHIWVSLGQYAYQDAINSANANVFLLLVGIALILIAGVVALIWTYNERVARQSLLLGWLLVFGFYGLGKAWEVGHTHQNDPRQLWVGEGTAPSVRTLTDVLEVASQRATGTEHDISLTVATDTPVLRWYLRDFARVSWVDALRPDYVTQAVITLAEEDQPLLGDSYLGTDFPMREEEPAAPSIRSVGRSLRWLFHRQGPTPQLAGHIVLWLREDVALVGR